MNLQGLRVLVVEDEPILAMMIEDYLEDLGCHVVGAATRLDEALKQANTLDLDVGVLDVNLAGELSYPVAEVLKGRAVKIVFATAYVALVAPADLRDIPVLTKPFHREQLANILLETCL